MTSPKKQSANKKNAQSSKGPIETSETRFNALKHGILSKESFIGVGDGREDTEAFREFAAYLQESLGPVGAIEELLVDKLIGLTWRSRRLLRFEPPQSEACPTQRSMIGSENGKETQLA